MDGFRGLATIAVVLFHMDHVPALQRMHASIGLGNLWPVLGFFFVISGFVLTLIYGQRLTDGRTVADFAIRRAGRLWPMHLFALGLFVCWELVRAIWSAVADRPDIVAFIDGRSVGELARNALLVHCWGIGRGFSWNAPSWTLSTELLAYAVFVAITLSIRRMDMRVLVALGITVTSGILYIHQAGVVKWSLSRVPWCLQGFFLGYLVCWMWQRWPVRSPLLGGAVEIGCAAGCALALFVGIEGVPTLLLWWVCVAGVVFSIANESSVVSRVLAWRPLRWLGDISLSVYVMHFPVILVLGKVLQPLAGMPGGVAEPGHAGAAVPVWLACAGVALLLALVVAIGALAHYYIDAPCRDGSARFATRIRRGEIGWPRWALRRTGAR